MARKTKLNNSLTYVVVELEPKISAETYTKLGNGMSPRKCVTSNNNKKIFLHSSAPLLDRTTPISPTTTGSIPKKFSSLFTRKLQEETIHLVSSLFQ